MVGVAQLAALSAIYESTKGSGWTTKTNWQSSDVSACDWHGITCDDAHSTVTHLELEDNNLSGTLPTEIGLLTGINSEFKLHTNSLRGSLPSEIGLLTAMTTALYLHRNSFTGSLPTELGKLRGMQMNIQLDQNSFAGRLPSELGQLTQLVQGLWAHDNSFTGAIPSELGQLTALTDYFGLHKNQFSGSIPSELGLLTHMTGHFKLSDNGYLCGSVPTQVSSLAAYVSSSSFDITTNNDELGTACCHASIPHPERYPCVPTPQPTPQPSVFTVGSTASREALVALYTQCGGSSWTHKLNWLASTHPCDQDHVWYGVTCNTAASDITELDLLSNSLIGSLPTQLGLLTEMTANFQLSANSLTGSVPTEIGLLTKLTEGLYLWGNSFTGNLPSELGQLTALTRSLSVNFNQFSGLLPSQLGKLTNLELELRGKSNQFSGSFPSELGLLTKLVNTFDFSHNLFCGDVPPEILTLESQVTTGWALEAGNAFGTTCSNDNGGGGTGDVEPIPSAQPVPFPTMSPHQSSQPFVPPVPAPTKAPHSGSSNAGSGGDSSSDASENNLNDEEPPFEPEHVAAAGAVVGVVMGCLAALAASRLAYLLICVDRPWERMRKLESGEAHGLVGVPLPGSGSDRACALSGGGDSDDSGDSDDDDYYGGSSSSSWRARWCKALRRQLRRSARRLGCSDPADWPIRLQICTGILALPLLVLGAALSALVVVLVVIDRLLGRCVVCLLRWWLRSARRLRRRTHRGEDGALGLIKSAVVDELNGGGSDEDYVYSGDEDDDDSFDDEHNNNGDGGGGDDDDNTSDAGSELSAASDELEYTATADGLLTLSVNPLKREARLARKAKLAQAKASGSFKDETGLNSIAEGGSDKDNDEEAAGGEVKSSNGSGSKRRSFFSMGLGRRRNRQGNSSGSSGGDVELNNNNNGGNGSRRSGQHVGLLSGRSSGKSSRGGGAVGVEDGLAVGKKKVVAMELGHAPPPPNSNSDFDAPPVRRLVPEDKPMGSKAKYHW